MDFIHTQKFVLTSPKKLREVAYLIKKLKPAEAVAKLPFIGKRAGDPLKKVIAAAIANARQKEVGEEALSIKELQILEGPRLKRYRAGARGRAKPYKRKMSHIKVVLTTDANKSEDRNTKSEINSKSQSDNKEQTEEKKGEQKK